jgi:alkanesulfonate monooxygenase SsuD/methylene tetrahydromethanopterin reductase-like flavin-dependent oxidoreductase (luciferase family)
LGYLCLFDNSTEEDGRTLVRQFVLVHDADRMGFSDIWLGEQHGDPCWPTGAATALLGHLAAAASKARIGTMALYPVLRDPIALAEDIATIDQLSKGRLNLGVGSGGAFPSALLRANISPGGVRPRFWESLDHVARLLTEGAPPSQGEHVTGNALRLVLRPAQSPIPTWVVGTDGSTIRGAAERGYGLMAAATHTDARLRRAMERYREARPGTDPRPVLARFACAAKTRDEALAIARPYLEAFVERARVRGWGTDRAVSAACDVNALVAQSLIGSFGEVAEQFKRLSSEFGAHGIAIVPTSQQFDAAKRILAAFVDDVRPLLWD